MPRRTETRISRIDTKKLTAKARRTQRNELWIPHFVAWPTKTPGDAVIEGDSRPPRAPLVSHRAVNDHAERAIGHWLIGHWSFSTSPPSLPTFANRGLVPSASSPRSPS